MSNKVSSKPVKGFLFYLILPVHSIPLSAEANCLEIKTKFIDRASITVSLLRARGHKIGELHEETNYIIHTKD